MKHWKLSMLPVVAIGLATACAEQPQSTEPFAPAFKKETGPANGTTLAATKTLDICTVDEGTWRYSGVVSVWNEGAVDTQGFLLNDYIQNKLGAGQFQSAFQAFSSTGVIPAGTTSSTATVFIYSKDSAPLAGDIRNIATITILNHSGSLGTPKGPEPKATYGGPFPPPACEHLDELGCTYTQGYWGNKPGVVWPAGFDRSELFFSSGMTWQEVLSTPPQGNGYYILAQQYIPAILNQANGAYVPPSIQTVLTDATTWFDANGPSACSANGSCGTQKTWGGILDTYNNGLYPEGPPHCGDEGI